MTSDVVSLLWQARIPKDLSDAVTADMRALGLATRTEVLREALTLFHRYARELIMAREIDTYYDGQPMPLSPVIAGMFGSDEPAGPTTKNDHAAAW